MEKKELRKITQEELDMILKKHKRWLTTYRKEGESADLSYVDLSYASLCGMYLFGANLSGANLSWTNLSGATLAYADLPCANLRYTNLAGAKLMIANLEGANLTRANMKYADLTGADLPCANLSHANMKFANLERANLGHADLTFADLKDANLKLADLTGVNLTNVKNLPDISMVCPETGLIICWKKALGGFIIKLEIPEDAKRSSAIGSRKCRCNKAKVLSIENLDGTPAEVTSVHSKHYPDFIYKVGETVEVPDFDENRFIECSNGIHFFMTRGEACAY